MILGIRPLLPNRWLFLFIASLSQPFLPSTLVRTLIHHCHAAHADDKAIW
jgi:hypothetical protein